MPRVLVTLVALSSVETVKDIHIMSCIATEPAYGHAVVSVVFAAIRNEGLYRHCGARAEHGPARGPPSIHAHVDVALLCLERAAGARRGGRSEEQRNQKETHWRRALEFP